MSRREINTKRILLPTSSEMLVLKLPERWNAVICRPKWLPVLSDKDIVACFESPYKAPRLRELAKGKRSAVVVVEDITRPMRMDRIVPVVLKELEMAGIERQAITIISAIGCHKPQSEPDFRCKLGNWIVDNYRTQNPSLHDNIVYMGDTTAGTPIWINAVVAAADVKVGVGGILPHPNAGFGGGGKTVLPGICGFETIVKHHLNRMDIHKGIGVVENNPFREDLESAAHLIGMDFVVNAIMGVDRNIVGLFVGDIIGAHRAGVAMARNAYSVEAPPDAELVIINAFPEDYDLIQATKALSRGMGIKSVRRGGRVLLIASCPDGIGYHALYGPGGPGHHGFKQRRETLCREYNVLVVSPSVGPVEFRNIFPEGTAWFGSVSDAVEQLERNLPTARVNVFPYGGISIVEGG